MLLAPITSAPKQIAAHRGFHNGTAPYENTIAAYRDAIAVGSDLLETDIWRTADGVLVLHHDARINGRSIGRTKFADLPCLPNGERLSTLQELVDLTITTGTSSRLLVETKESGYESAIVDMLRARLRPGQYELMSFNLDSVRALRELAPDSKVGVLFGLVPDWKTGTWPISGAAMVSKARALGVDFVAVDHKIANNERLQALADAKLDIAVWTVDKQLDIQRFLADTRVSTIITDRPDLAISLRDRSLDHVSGAQAADWWESAVAA